MDNTSDCECEYPESEKADNGAYWCLNCHKWINTPEPPEYEPELTEEEINSLDKK